MSIKTKGFTAFGRDYETVQFNAVPALAMMELDEIHPCDLLQNTKVMHEGRWVQFNSEFAVNEALFDAAGVIAPTLVMRAVAAIVHEFNFEFLSDWKPIKMPSRFKDEAPSVKSANVDPIVSQLIQDGLATLRDLEEYYSLEDAFKMFDITSSKVVNECLANEAAKKKR